MREGIQEGVEKEAATHRNGLVMSVNMFKGCKGRDKVGCVSVSDTLERALCVNRSFPPLT